MQKKWKEKKINTKHATTHSIDIYSWRTICEPVTSQVSPFCLRHHCHLNVARGCIMSTHIHFFPHFFLILLLPCSFIVIFCIAVDNISLFLLAVFVLGYTEFHTLWIMLKILYSWRGNFFSQASRVCNIQYIYIPMCLFVPHGIANSCFHISDTYTQHTYTQMLSCRSASIVDSKSFIKLKRTI